MFSFFVFNFSQFLTQDYLNRSLNKTMYYSKNSKPFNPIQYDKQATALNVLFKDLIRTFSDCNGWTNEVQEKK